MKPILAFVTAVVLTVAASGLLLAQRDPGIGTWKLSLAKSKYDSPAQPPKSETEKVEAQRDGSTKISFEGVAADGSAIAFSFTTKYDGKDSTVSGTGPNGQDSIAVKRIDLYTVTSISKKGDTMVAAAKTVISKDGKVMTLTSNGVDPEGNSRKVVLVWDKQ